MPSSIPPSSASGVERPGKKCPECQKRFEDLFSHLRKEHKGGSEEHSKKQEALACPWPNCDISKGSRIPLEDHFASHTNSRKQSCPHVLTRGRGKKALCRFYTGKSNGLMHHRKIKHGFAGTKGSVDPWVTDREEASKDLQSAELFGGNLKRKDTKHSATARTNKLISRIRGIPSPSRFQEHSKSKEDEQPAKVEEVLDAIYKMNNGPLLTMKAESEDEDIWLNTELHKKPAE